jgi:3-deoxy-manno-octulosonate cytidylyltransferase (CMP-KDO synthetase)
MKPLIVIPARLAAVRLPNKPLANIHNQPMIMHVYNRARTLGLPVIVAAGDPEIVDVIHYNGGQAILTDPALPSGTDRVWAATQIFDPQGDYDCIVNLQGDLPTINPSSIQVAVDLLAQSDFDITTVAAPVVDPHDLTTPNVVKAVISHKHQGLYFSRNTIPFGDGVVYHHIGLYAFRRAALQRFVSLPPSPLEQRERLEQLRALEDGMRIGVGIVHDIPVSVDHLEDLEKARALLRPQQ